MCAFLAEVLDSNAYWYDLATSVVCVTALYRVINLYCLCTSGVLRHVAIPRPPNKLSLSLHNQIVAAQVRILNANGKRQPLQSSREITQGSYGNEGPLVERWCLELLRFRIASGWLASDPPKSVTLNGSRRNSQWGLAPQVTNRQSLGKRT